MYDYCGITLPRKGEKPQGIAKIREVEWIFKEGTMIVRKGRCALLNACSAALKQVSSVSSPSKNLRGLSSILWKDWGVQGVMGCLIAVVVSASGLVGVWNS
ncbi:hypothetical protein [Infirmifilum sp.]|uniref:hypothetical protein n=1 Tax=Infirmifilum sp. TaxID=2856575 RepID=UPI003D0C5382